MFGYMGQILRVDLTKGKLSKEALKENDCRMFLGGSGLATKYLFDEVPKGTDPLGPDNKLVFMTGPLTGTESPSAGRYCVVTKSPLTGFWGEGNSGGSWGVYLKNSGFDGIIFEGISPKPVYMVIDDGNAELKDARHLWGKGVGETSRLIKEELSEDFHVACIGIAGENLVRYAGIFNDIHRPAGRCGVGTVMGSKRLKAVAARGTQEIKIANKDVFSQISKRNYDLVNESLEREAKKISAHFMEQKTLSDARLVLLTSFSKLLYLLIMRMKKLLGKKRAVKTIQEMINALVHFDLGKKNPETMLYATGNLKDLLRQMRS